MNKREGEVERGYEEEMTRGNIIKVKGKERGPGKGGDRG
jgi:hypothetical protein